MGERSFPRVTDRKVAMEMGDQYVNRALNSLSFVTAAHQVPIKPGYWPEYRRGSALQELGGPAFSFFYLYEWNMSYWTWLLLCNERDHPRTSSHLSRVLFLT